MCQVKLIDQSLDIAYDLIFHVQKHQFIRLIEGNEDIYKEIKSISYIKQYFDNTLGMVRDKLNFSCS